MIPTLDLPLVLYERRQPQFRPIPVLSIKKTAKDRNLTFDPGLAQRSSFRETGNSEPAAPLRREGTGDSRAAMPVCIGFHDGQNLASRSGRPANRLVVAHHGTKINPRPSAIRSHV